MKYKGSNKIWLWGGASCVLSLILVVTGIINFSQLWQKCLAVIAPAVLGLAVDEIIIYVVFNFAKGYKSLKKISYYITALAVIMLASNIGITVVSFLTITYSIKIAITCLIGLLKICVCCTIAYLAFGMLASLQEYKQEAAKKAQTPSALDAFAILGIPPQYKKDGSLKTVYDMVGIKPQYNRDGKRMLTIYEKLGINPLFKADGTEVPYVLRIKNRARAFAKPAAATIDLYYKPRPRATGKDLPHGGAILPPPAGKREDPKAKNPDAPIVIIKQDKKTAAKPKPQEKIVYGGKDTLLSGGKSDGKVNVYKVNQAPVKAGGVFEAGVASTVPVVSQPEPKTSEPKPNEIKPNASTTTKVINNANVAVKQPPVRPHYDENDVQYVNVDRDVNVGTGGKAPELPKMQVDNLEMNRLSADNTIAEQSADNADYIVSPERPNQSVVHGATSIVQPPKAPSYGAREPGLGL